MATEQARAGTLGKGDEVMGGRYDADKGAPAWPHFTVRDRPALGRDTVAIPVRLDSGSHDLITLPSSTMLEVVRYERPGAIKHGAMGGYGGSKTACGKRGGVIATTPPDITCPMNGCQRVKRAWEQERALAANIEGERYKYANEGDAVARFTVPFDGPATVTIAGRSYSASTIAEAKAVARELGAAHDALMAVVSIYEARVAHPDITAEAEKAAAS